MKIKEAIIELECQLTNIVGEYAAIEMPAPVKRIYDAMNLSKKALKAQETLKDFISGYKESDFVLLTTEQLVSILEELEVE